jgi:hypothetical protein
LEVKPSTNTFLTGTFHCDKENFFGELFERDFLIQKQRQLKIALAERRAIEKPTLDGIGCCDVVCGVVMCWFKW